MSGKREPSKGIERAKVITIHSKYLPLTEDNNDDLDDSDEDETSDETMNPSNRRNKNKPNKRQRQRTRLQRQHDEIDNDNDLDDHWHNDDSSDINDHNISNEPIAHDWNMCRDAMAKLTATAATIGEWTQVTRRRQPKDVVSVCNEQLMDEAVPNAAAREGIMSMDWQAISRPSCNKITQRIRISQRTSTNVDTTANCGQAMGACDEAIAIDTIRQQTRRDTTDIDDTLNDD